MKAIIFQGQSQYDVLRRFSYRYAKGLKNNGVETILFDLNLLRNPQEYLELVNKFKPDFTLGFNPITILFENGLTHFEKTKIPHFAFIVDHPYYHMNRALKNPNHPLVHILYTEKNYDFSINKLGLKKITKKRYFASEQVLNTNFEEKIFDVVFFGSFQSPKEILNIIDSQIQDKKIAGLTLRFLDDIKYFVTKDKSFLPNDIEIYFLEYLKVNLPNISETELNRVSMNLFSFIDKYYRQITREETLKAFAQEGLNITVFGNDMLKKSLEEFNNVTVHGPVSYQDCMNIVAQSKVTLNSSAMYQSYHDRIPLIYANKSILCTNIMQDLMDTLPQSLNNTLYYNMDNIQDVSNIIKDLINDKEEYNSIVEDAYIMASNHFSVENDIQELLDIYKKVFA